MRAAPYSDQKNWSNTYLTDPAVLALLGRFDLDPCTPPVMPWRTADLMLTKREDGLAFPWYGRVFMNPPYRNNLRWAQKFVENGSGVALLNGRSSETKATQVILAACSALWLPAGRLWFYKPDGSRWDQKWFSSLLIGMTGEDADRLRDAAAVFGGQVLRR